MKLVERVKPQGFRHARTERHAYSHDAGKDVGGAPSFEETEYHAPHAAQGKPVEVERHYIIRYREQTEGDEREFG